MFLHFDVFHDSVECEGDVEDRRLIRAQANRLSKRLEPLLVHTEGILVLRQLREFVTPFGIRDGRNRWLRIPTAAFLCNLHTLERFLYFLLERRHHAPDGAHRGLRRLLLSRLPACARCGGAHNKGQQHAQVVLAPEGFPRSMQLEHWHKQTVSSCRCPMQIQGQRT